MYLHPHFTPEALVGAGALGAFLAGALHTLGPGHGKAAILAMGASGELEWRALLRYCALVAAGHSGGAILMGVALFMSWTSLASLGAVTRVIGTALGIVIACLGVAHIWEVTSGKAPTWSHRHDDHHDESDGRGRSLILSTDMHSSHGPASRVASLMPVAALLPSPLGIALVFIPLLASERQSAVLLPAAYGFGAFVSLIAVGWLTLRGIAFVQSHPTRVNLGSLAAQVSGAVLVFSGIAMTWLSWRVDFFLA